MTRSFLFLIFLFTVIILFSDPVFAASNANWVKPVTDFATSLQGGMVKIGSAVVGIGVIIVGIIASLAGHMHWDKFGYVLLGGILIMTGPAALKALLGTVQ